MSNFFYDSVLESEFAFEQEYLEDIMSSCFEDNLKKMVNELAPLLLEAYTPNQIFSKSIESLSNNSVFSEVIRVRGIFKPGNGVLYSNGYYYDTLQEEISGVSSLKILVPAKIRNTIKLNSHVLFSGMLIKRADSNKSLLELQFRVDSFVEELKSNAISDEDLKRISLIQKKNAKGKKPVKASLKNILMQNNKPRVLIIYALTSITDQDFEKAVKSAGSQIDFIIDKSVSFANTTALINKLKEADKLSYNAICLVRGGGGGMEKLDEIPLLECLVDMNTPTIGGVGHVGEEYSIKSVFDENAGTPSLLGQYFDNLVKETAQEREGTINNLVRNIEARYKPQLDRLAKLEKDSKADKDQINKLLEEKKSNIDNYTKINNELIDLRRTVDSKIRNAKRKMIVQLYIWIVISLICIIVTVILFYLYGQNQFWW